MSKLHIVHRCEACGSAQPRWAGRCPACGEWNSLREELSAPASAPPQSARGRAEGSLAAQVGSPRSLDEVVTEGHTLMATGLSELDRALSGGLSPGSSTLLGGEPGTGKSTLLLQALASLAQAGHRCLLVAAEEPAQQVRRRAERLGAALPGLFVTEARQLPELELAIAQLGPQVVVVDSVQAVLAPALPGPAGSVSQVRECALALTAWAKAAGFALVLVGHVTKDGALAGPRVLEHMVDTVLTFEGDRYSSLRALRAVKHRFGPTGETGLFEMGERGLTGVADPSAMFLADRLRGASGSAVTVPMEGYRPVLVEVQALTGRAAAVPRRVVTGADPARVAFLVAVLEKRAGVPVGASDIYVSVAGGGRATEPAVDLAICLALASSWSCRPLPPDLLVVGEVGLGGELRRVNAMGKRLAEACRLGFKRALVPHGAGGRSATTSMEVVAVSNLDRAIAEALGPDLVAAPQAYALASGGAGEVERGHDRSSWLDCARSAAP